MKKLLILLSLIALFIVACGSQTASDAPVADVDVATLPDTIDVNTANALRGRDDVVLIDVREQWEYDEGHIPGVELIPINEVPARMSEIPTDKTVVLTCRTGNRSGQVFDFLTQNGFDNVHNMEGGIVAWQAAGLPVE
ncbi:MAG: rhodanese-like domain-containing protein [Anaerolineae bacterium]|nr:rhodanese-like domain-containing protein [Anaerolineae bacterium]MCO5188060.1 rhodanese-like domain-containing protein [Anaerolineae bacterium]MCO5192102.1 rhodanese-like domain-containing protein [Anaerolineae bacterium]MCO5196371.1 rhodanese-like domain-containing protein [Anaerolineae bacterium]MCO5204329.1 rhodanese-like domain-containing protein [Anaerolineae bacterium]